jgi:hypothetical protein
MTRYSSIHNLTCPTRRISKSDQSCKEALYG